MAETFAGFRYQPELIGGAHEAALLARIRELPFEHFDFHGYKGKRRVVSFGWRYDYAGRGLQQAQEIPDYLLELRERAEAFAERDPGTFHQVLVTEYSVFYQRRGERPIIRRYLPQSPGESLTENK